MFVASLLLIIGLALLLSGGQMLVTGASRLASVFGISELAIGLTVVAFGTSAPELSVNVLAAIEGNTSIAFGNIIGSNIANVGLVIGMAAMLRPLSIESAIVSREIPMMLGATAAAIVLGLDRMRAAPEFYDRSDGLILLLFFSVFLFYSIADMVGSHRDSDAVSADAAHEASTSESTTMGWAALQTVGGLGILVGGGQLTLTNAVVIAETLEVPSVVIGLTVVALGTSLPELATTLAAVSKGKTNLAIGNVLGSNIFNLLFILGTTAVIRPVEVPAVGGLVDLAALAAYAAFLLILARSSARIGRRSGVVLLASYVGYILWRFQS